MKCDSFQQEIPLYVYGELAAPAEDLFEEHLSHCGGCAEEFKKYRRFSSIVSDAAEEPPLWFLAECRQSISHLTEISPKRTQSIGKTFSWEWLLGSSIGFKVPVGALVLLALGFLGARLMPGLLPAVGATSATSRTMQAGMISTVRSVQPDANGRVQIDVDETRRRAISGSVQDPEIQRLLLTALREESNAGVRVEALTVLKDGKSDANVRRALLEAVVHDPNPGVRMRALDGLKRFEADAEIRKTLSQVLLTDANPGVRMQVIDFLTSRKDDPQQGESIVGVLQKLVEKDDNSYVRQRCHRALQELNASEGTF